MHQLCFYEKTKSRPCNELCLGKAKRYIQVSPLSCGLPGYEVNLKSLLTWAVREMKLLGHNKEEIKVNLKIDGSQTILGQVNVICLTII